MRLSRKICLLITLVMTTRALSALQAARELEAPVAQSSDNGEMEGAEFWEQHASLLKNAWQEWEAFQQLPHLDADELLDEELREAVDSAWNDHAKEDEIRKLWTEVAPNVYRCQFFNPRKIKLIREHIDKASYESKIPTRRPNSMNRYGLLLNPDIHGAVNLEGFQKFYRHLLDHYIRPLGRLLFTEYIGEGDDHFSYAFTIRYTEGEDVTLKEHSDASLVTFNVNLNTPETEFEGSTLYFLDKAGSIHNVTFEPGMALLHLGQTRHASFPLEAGERTNLVAWLFGEYGYVRIVPYEKHERLSQKERWTKPKLMSSSNDSGEL
jgi:hypothetical protein